MPIYEFYCRDCHTIFSFFSPRVDTTTEPACPKCGRRPLDRRVSRFAISKGRTEPASRPQEDMSPTEARMMQAIEQMAGEAESIDENDPRQIASYLKRLYSASGLPLGDAMEEAMRRMEAGEDPDKIDEELGERLDAEMPFGEEGAAEEGEPRQRWKVRRRPPAVDETLYTL